MTKIELKEQFDIIQKQEEKEYSDALAYAKANNIEYGLDGLSYVRKKYLAKKKALFDMYNKAPT